LLRLIPEASCSVKDGKTAMVMKERTDIIDEEIEPKEREDAS
jgi:hypothetical protein